MKRSRSPRRDSLGSPSPLKHGEFKVVGLIADADRRAAEWMCKSHLTKKWDRTFLVPVDPTLDSRARTILWRDYSPSPTRKVTVFFEDLDDGMPKGVQYGV